MTSDEHPTGVKATEKEMSPGSIQWERLKHSFDIVRVLTQKEMKVKYKSSFFGYFWSIGHPLAFALVFFVAFKIVMRIEVENYAVFLIAGLFPWQWFNNAATSSPLVLFQNASIIKKVNFPRNLITFTQVLLDMIHFIFAIPVIVLFLLMYHKYPTLTWLYGIPALLLIQFCITYGLCLIISSINLFFRDLERLTVIFMTLLFYFTPVFYPDSMVPAKYQYALKMNPLALLIINWRNIFLYGKLDLSFLLLSFIYSIAILAIGYYVYRKLSWKYAEVL